MWSFTILVSAFCCCISSIHHLVLMGSFLPLWEMTLRDYSSILILGRYLPTWCPYIYSLFLSSFFISHPRMIHFIPLVLSDSSRTAWSQGLLVCLSLASWWSGICNRQSGQNLPALGCPKSLQITCSVPREHRRHKIGPLLFWWPVHGNGRACRLCSRLRCGKWVH